MKNRIIIAYIFILADEPELEEDNWLDENDKLPRSELKSQADWKNYVNLENGGSFYCIDLEICRGIIGKFK